MTIVASCWDRQDKVRAIVSPTDAAFADSMPPFFVAGVDVDKMDGDSLLRETVEVQGKMESSLQNTINLVNQSKEVSAHWHAAWFARRSAVLPLQRHNLPWLPLTLWLYAGRTSYSG
jgi:hypothetical protein